ncbi:phage portal protein [Anaeroselena agilis]|uniref:Phage portal protein n=1 Tax=Anaeroselena agilis TaxID=3063788 RepID=A0ABU3NYG6_9FIRM|nr:phage portal protein [Selenomonadales bacterium 4137-cl]
MSNKRQRQKARQPTAPAAAAPGLVITARQVLRALNTGYSEGGASTSKGSMKGWTPEPSSPQSDIDVNLPLLRARSRSAVMNQPLAASAIATSRTHVIGAGLQVRPKIDWPVLGISQEKAKVWQRRTRRRFEVWARSKFCDLHRKNNFYDLQDIAYTGYLTNGDGWAALKYRPPLPGMPYSLRIQLFEADRVCNPDSPTMGALTLLSVRAVNTNNGNRIINGVEIDDDGAVVAYWICNRYPYDPTNMTEPPKWIRVEAFGKETGQPNILQICHDTRSEEYRGVPYLAPVLEALKQVTRYTEAELTAAIIKAFFTVFFEQQLQAGPQGFPLAEAVPDEEKVSIDPNDFELGAGSMNVLPPGYKANQIDAGRSISAYEPFTTQLIRQIAACLEQPYEVLIKAFTSSYSASRAALLQAWMAFKMRRTWFARDFNQPIYEAWLAEAVAIGDIEAPGFFDDPMIRAAWCGAEWYGPVMGVLDPVKEAEGAALRIEHGLSTGEKEAAEMTGTDWEENIAQRGMELQAMVAAGVTVPQMTGNTTPTKGGKKDDE